MAYPTASELPAPPIGRIGWPWTEGCTLLPSIRQDGKPWPRISIVTPSFNQGAFIEETIRSVLLQGYPNLEYIIMDGGSSDSTMEVVKKYSPWLSHYESVKDRGQAHAINKGFALATGELFQWINSDDVLLPDALRAIASAPCSDAYAAGVIYFSTNNQSVRQNFGLTPPLFITQGPDFSFHQPGLWMRKAMADSVFPLEEDLHYVFDWYLWARYVAMEPRISYINTPVVKFRIHEGSKTTSSDAAHSIKFESEVETMLCRLQGDFTGTYIEQLAKKRLEKVRWRRHLRDASQARGMHALSNAAQIIAAIIKHPTRLDRYSLGALRRIVMQGWC